jgi:signal transduction histidine kinase
MALSAALRRRPDVARDDAPPVDAVRTATVCLLLQRVSYLVHPAVTGVVAASAGAPLALAFGLVFVGQAAWSTVLLTTTWRRRSFPAAWVWCDVASIALVELLLTRAALNDPVMSTLDYRTRLDMAAATLAGAALSYRGVAGAVLILSVVRIAGTELAAVDWSTVLYRINSYVWWAAVAWALMRFLRLQVARAERATARLVDVEASRAAERARLAERWAQRRRLHDTVLATLTAIARGGLDHRRDEVRRRCAREAEYVRRLVRAEDGPPTGLGEALGRVIEDAEALGLGVRFAGDKLIEDPPQEVVTAFSEAVREALNNVARHSGGTTAWVTVMVESDVYSVRIVDRGPGAGVAGGSGGGPGLGIRESIVERMRAVGGCGRVDVVAGQGAYVELTWPSR